MSDTDLAKRVCELEERVNYLERELELSVDEEKFERQIKRIAPNGNDYEVDTNGMGYYTATISVLPGDLPYVANRIDDMDGLGWQVRESDEDSITLSIEEGLITQ